MSPAGFVSLIAITTVSVVAAGVVLAIQPGNTGSGLADGRPMFPELADSAAGFREMVIEQPAYTLHLVRSNDAWLAAERGDYPVNGEMVANLLAGLATMTRVEPKTDNPQWYQYIGVGGPDAAVGARGTRVAVTSGEGDELVDVVIGQRSESIGFAQFGGTFVRPSEDAQAWLVEGAVFVPAVLADWFTPLFHISGPDIASVAILEHGEPVLEAEKADPQSGNYVLTQLDPTLGPPESVVDADAIRTLTQATVSVTFEEVRPRGEIALPQDARTIRFETGDGLRVDLTPVAGEAHDWVLIDASAPEGSAAAGRAAEIDARTRNWAFALPERRMELLNRPLDTLVMLPQEAEEQAEETPPVPPLPFLGGQLGN